MQNVTQLLQKRDEQLLLSGSGGRIMYGFSSSVPSVQYTQALGHSPAIRNEFFKLSRTGFENPKGVNAYVEGVKRDLPNSLVMLTLEPFVGLSVLTDETYTSIAAQCIAWNRAGVKLYLRFAHEMNADWYAWGAQPVEYIKAFRALALAIHAEARKQRVSSYTRMVWAPNVGFDGLEKTYLTYYPGDDVVDWVGLSLYWFPVKDPEPGAFINKLTTGGGENFYKMFCVQRRKPLMIAETSAPTLIGMFGPRELTHKRSWWQQVYSAEHATRFPMLRAVFWFEFTKKGHNYGTFTNPIVGAAFLQDLPGTLVYAP